MNIEEVLKNKPNNATHYKNGRYYMFFTGSSLVTKTTYESYVYANGAWKSLAGFNGFDDSFIEISEGYRFNNFLYRPTPNGG